MQPTSTFLKNGFSVKNVNLADKDYNLSGAGVIF